jgi:histidine triad (HIT) family protein
MERAMTQSYATCIFCRIAAGTAPAHFVYQDARIAAFLDINPIRPGHVQIVPRAHVPYFDDLPPDLAADIIFLGQRLAKLLKARSNVRRVAFCFTGGDVPHAHAHVLPLVAPTDITSRRYIAEEQITFRAMPRASEDELAEMAAALRAGL